MGIEGGFSRCTRPPGILKVLHHFFLNTIEPVKASPSGVAALFWIQVCLHLLGFSVLEMPQGEKPRSYIGTQRNNAIDMEHALNMEHALIRGREDSSTFVPPLGTNHVRIYQFNPSFGWKTKQ